MFLQIAFVLIATRVDLNAILAGQQVTIPLNDRAVFIRHLTPDQQQIARSPSPQLHDRPASRYTVRDPMGNVYPTRLRAG